MTAQHEYEPGDTYRLMHSDAMCEACGEARTSPVHDVPEEPVPDRIHYGSAQVDTPWLVTFTRDGVMWMTANCTSRDDAEDLARGHEGTRLWKATPLRHVYRADPAMPDWTLALCVHCGHPATDTDQHIPN